MATNVLDPYADLFNPQAARIPLANAYNPALDLPSMQPGPQRNLLAAGLSSGVDQLQGTAGAALAAVGTAVGAQGLTDFGTEMAKRNALEAQANGRADLEANRWSPSGIAYTVAQQIPNMAALLGGSALAGAIAPVGAAAGALGLARVGAAVPQILGGARGLTGAAGAARAAGWGTEFLGAAAVGAPLGTGSMFNEAIERGEAGGEAPTRGDALKAIGLGPAYGALEAIQPVGLKNIFAKGLEGNLVKRVATAGAIGAVSEMPTEAAQTALELSFRPDISASDKAGQIVEAALLGGVVGGIFGGAAGIRRMKSMDPRTTTNDDMKAITDEALQPEQAQAQLPGPEIAGLLPAPPKPPPSIADVFANMDDAKLSDTRAQAEQIIASGAEVPPEIERTLGLLRAEEARRATGAEAAQPELGGLFPEAAFDQTKPASAAAAATAEAPVDAAPAVDAVEQTRKRAVDMAGGKAQWIAKLDATDDAGLVDAVLNRLEAGVSDKKTFKLAEALGILDGKGEERDLAGELAAAKQVQSRAEIMALANPAAQPDVAKAAAAVSDIEQKLNVLQNVQQRRAGGSVAEQQAAPVGTPPLAARPAPNTAAAPASETRAPEAQAALDLTFARQPTPVIAVDSAGQARQAEIAPTPAPQTFSATKEFVKGIVGRSNSVIANLDAKNPPEIVREAVAALSARKPNQTMTKIGEYFGLVQGGKTVPLPQAIATMEGKIGTLRRQIDALPVNAAPRSRQLAAQVGEMQEKLDALRAAQSPVAEDIATGGASAAAVKNPGLEEEQQAQNLALRTRMRNIQQDRSVPPAMRRAAQIAGQQLRENRTTAAEAAAAVEADYTATTGRPAQSTAGTAGTPSGLVNDFPAWANDIATSVNGEVVGTSGETALVRTLSRAGKPIYVMATPTQRGNFDIDDAKNETVVAKDTLAKLRALKAELVKGEEANAAAHPDGPFVNMEPGSNVKGSANMDPRYVGYLADLSQSLGLGDVRIFLLHAEDIVRDRAAHGLYGDYYSALDAASDPNEFGSTNNFGRTAKDFYIALKPGMTEQQSLEIIAHELGHIVDRTQYANASAETKAAIHKDYEAWLARTQRMTPTEIVRALRNSETGQMQLAEMGASPSLNMRYWTSFAEWFADNTSKWATTSAKPVSLVDKFFAGVAAAMRRLVTLYTGRLGNPDRLPAKAIKDFLDAQSPNKPFAWAGPTPVRGRSQSVAGLTPQRLNEASKRYHAMADTVFQKYDKLSLRDLKASTRQIVLGWQSLGHLAIRHEKTFPQLAQLFKAHQDRTATASILAQGFAKTNYAVEQLMQRDRAAGEATVELMKASEFRLDPRKSWNDHPFLHQERNAPALARMLAKANEQYRKLRQKGVANVYDDLTAMNDAMHFATMAVSTHNMVASDPLLVKDLPTLTVDPMMSFRENASLHQNPQASRAFWLKAVNDQQAAAAAYLTAQRGNAAKTTVERERDAITRRITPLELRVKAAAKSMAAMAEAPYFHLGRHGDFFVTFEMKKDKDGVVDRAAIKQVSDALAAAGFADVTLSQDNERPVAFLRVEKESQAEEIYKIMRGLQRQKWLTSKEIARGKRTSGDAFAEVSPEWLNKFIEAVQSDPSLDAPENASAEKKAEALANKQRMVSTARELWLDMLPDTAIAKVLTHRDNVPGYHPDMMRNFAFRMQISINSLSNLSAAKPISDAFTNMKSAVNEAKVTDDLNPSAMQDIVTELQTREDVRPLTVGRNFTDTLRAVNHAFFLGFSPAYMAVNMTQLGVLLWPELSKKHGFMDSAKAIAKVTPMALRIAGQTIKSGWALGAKHVADAVITNEVLDNSKLDASTKDFLLKVIMSGNIDIGSASRELGTVAEGQANAKLSTALKFAAANGYYTEIVTRLIAALAARELNGKNTDAVDYANRTVTQSMLQYANWNVARQMGKMGVAGPASPIMFSFMQYSAQLIEKMQRELMVAFVDSNASATDKSEAKRFLGAHMVGITTFAGTLGLPAASIFARAAEKLVDLFDDDEEPFDAKAAWRNMLSDMFGKDVGEVIARGLPRAIGMDISNRAGEADIIPFTKLLTDRRKWEDASKDFAFDMLGSPISMAAGFVTGGGAMMKGDVIEGMKAMLPVFMKGGVNAFSMSQNGYTDKAGNKLPMEAGANDILMQALGFNPAEKAEYTEAKMAQTVRKGDLVRAASDLRRHLASAIESGDRETAKGLIEQAQAFDEKNPAYSVMNGISGTLQQRAKARALASSTGNPMGTNLKDVGASSLTDFANF